MLIAANEHGAANGFAARFSVEATKPTAAEIAAMAAALPRGTEIYITAVPKLPTSTSRHSSRLLGSTL